MPYEKGHKKLGGRTKGVKNKAVTEVGAFFRSVLETDEWQQKWHDYFTTTSMQKVEPKLVALAYAYGYGKPHETLAVSGELTLKQDVEQAQTQTKHQLLRLIQGGRRGDGHGNGSAGEPDPAAPAAATA